MKPVEQRKTPRPVEKEFRPERAKMMDLEHAPRLAVLHGKKLYSESGSFGLAVKIRLQLDGIVFICIFSFKHEDGHTKLAFDAFCQ